MLRSAFWQAHLFIPLKTRLRLEMRVPLRQPEQQERQAVHGLMVACAVLVLVALALLADGGTLGAAESMPPPGASAGRGVPRWP